MKVVVRMNEDAMSMRYGESVEMPEIECADGDGAFCVKSMGRLPALDPEVTILYADSDHKPSSSRGDEDPARRAHVLARLSKEPVRLVQPMQLADDAMPEPAHVRTHVLVPVAKHGHQRLVLRKVADRVLDEVARKVHRALGREPPFGHEDGNDIVRMWMLCVRGNVLEEARDQLNSPGQSSEKAAAEGSIPLPRK